MSAIPFGAMESSACLSPSGASAAPPLTVVISTRDRGDSVTTPLRTILSNDYPNFEVIIVDQSMDERTEAALKPFAEDPRIRYIRSATKGLATARNVGIGHARAEFIVMTDDDCEVPINWLREWATAFGVDHKVGVVFGNVLAAPHDRAAGFIVAYQRREPILARSIRDKCRVEGAGGCMGLRRSTWQHLGGFDEMLGAGAPFKSAEETDFTIRALLAAYFVYETPAVSVVHHGFRPWEHIYSVTHGYWYGTGAAFAKHLKCGHGSVVPVLLRLAWRWAFGTPPVAVGSGGRTYKLSRLSAFARGFVRGVFTSADKPRGHYLKPVVGA